MSKRTKAATHGTRAGHIRAADKVSTGSEGADAGPTMFSIGDLADASGVPVETIRVWERRYGRPKSERLPSGHRRYSGAQIAWLRTVAAAVAAGMRASAAVTASPALLQSIGGPTPAPLAAEVVAMLKDARELRGPDLRRRLRRAAAAQPVIEFLETRACPFLTAVGHEWAAGTIEVRHEHLASQIVGDLLRDIRRGAVPRSRAAAVVVTTLPDDRHDLGAQMVFTIARMAGLRSAMLGADTPVRDIVAAAHETHASAVAVSISASRGGVAADALLREIGHGVGPGVRLLVGGAGARGPRRPPRGVEILPDLAALDAAFATLRRRPQ